MADIAAPAARRPPLSLDWFWVIPPVAILAGLFLYPLALILGEALTGGTPDISLAHFAAVLSTAAFRTALLHTIEIAVAASAGCIALGLVIALILAFVPFPGSRLVARLIETYIALPTFLAALALTFLYGSAGILNETLMMALGLDMPPVDFLYSPWGVILAEVTVYTPFVLRPLLAAFSLIEASQIEVASSLGLLLTVNEFGIVLFIGAKGVITLPLLVYDKAIQEFDYTAACVIAVVNVVLSLSLYTVYRLAIARFGGRNAGVV